MLRFLASLLIILFIGLIGWHVFIALTGGAIIVAGTAWIVLAVTVCAFCVAILLPFIFAGLGILILGGIVGIWTIVALVLFPVFFPILLPLFFLFWFVAYALRKSKD